MSDHHVDHDDGQAPLDAPSPVPPSEPPLPEEAVPASGEPAEAPQPGELEGEHLAADGTPEVSGIPSGGPSESASVSGEAEDSGRPSSQVVPPGGAQPEPETSAHGTEGVPPEEHRPDSGDLEALSGSGAQPVPGLPLPAPEAVPALGHAGHEDVPGETANDAILAPGLAVPSGEADPMGAAASVPGAALSRRRRRPSRRAMQVSGIASIALALLVGGMVAGWHVSDSRAAARVLPEPSIVTVPAFDPGSSAVTMPDVRGLREEIALQVVADAGIDPALVSTSTRPWAGEAGQVIEQTPVFGTASPSEVRLVLSEEARVPATDGRLANDVAGEISALGAQVIMAHEYRPGVQAGSVLAIEPPVGEKLSAQVIITQADSPVSVYLREIDSLEDKCSNQEVKLNGPTFDFGMVCSASSSSSESVWLLSRVVDSVTGQIGIPDTADPATRARVEIVVDGQTVLDTVLGYGSPPVPLELTTTGALRFTVRITNASETKSSAQVGLGDVRLVGSVEAIETLSKD